MKITYPNNRRLRSEERRYIANKGCDKCPCCGETGVGEPFKRTGIHGGLTITYYPIFGKTKYADCYLCQRCGAEWNSDKYW